MQEKDLVIAKILHGKSTRPSKLSITNDIGLLFKDCLKIHPIAHLDIPNILNYQWIMDPSPVHLNSFTTTLRSRFFSGIY